jgi:hypothetical protein
MYSILIYMIGMQIPIAEYKGGGLLSRQNVMSAMKLVVFVVRGHPCHRAQCQSCICADVMSLCCAMLPVSRVAARRNSVTAFVTGLTTSETTNLSVLSAITNPCLFLV